MTSKSYFVEFEEGEIVYLLTDPDQSPRMVTGYTMRGDQIRYELSIGEENSWHRGMEISREKSQLFIVP